MLQAGPGAGSLVGPGPGAGSLVGPGGPVAVAAVGRGRDLLQGLRGGGAPDGPRAVSLRPVDPPSTATAAVAVVKDSAP